MGTHDFSSFRSSKCTASNPVKTINQIIVDANADLITLKITANSFLQNMIRIIVGTLLDASKSKARLSIKDLDKHTKNKVIKELQKDIKDLEKLINEDGTEENENNIITFRPKSPTVH